VYSLIRELLTNLPTPKDSRSKNPMTQRIGVAVVHGVGKQGPEFVEKIAGELRSRCKKQCGDDIVIRPVHWGGEMQAMEDELWDRLKVGGPLDFIELRRFLIDFVGDAFAYQPSTSNRDTYDRVHSVLAKAIRGLAQEAGETAPLCVIAHSLGSIIASNYIYDLQNPWLISPEVRHLMGDTPMDRGETLALLYTLGSPLAIFCLRFKDFGKPIEVPSPVLAQHYPDLKGEWVNFYDRDDVIGFPLRTLSRAYQKVVTRDREVNVGSPFMNWTPLSHMHYWTDRDVIVPISRSLIRTWKTVNKSVIP
jgi:hypothetical protein